jgi:hypothetical protein
MMGTAVVSRLQSGGEDGLVLITAIFREVGGVHLGVLLSHKWPRTAVGGVIAPFAISTALLSCGVEEGS